MKKILSTLPLLFLFYISSFSQATYINEVNYLASNPAQGIEIAGQAGQDLTGWSIEQYSPGGELESVESLDGMVIPDKQNGQGTIWTEATVSYIGGRSALVNDQGDVVQVLNYGLWGTLGSILPIQDGSAAGMIGEFIGVQLLPGSSLQLVGTGTVYDDFSWLLPGTVTPGEVNTWQLFSFLGGLLFSEEGGSNAPFRADNIQLYPNPASDFARVDLHEINVEVQLDVLVFDQQGRLMSRNRTYGGQYLDLNISNWSSGTYILQIVTKDQKYSTTLIKQ